MITVLVCGGRSFGDATLVHQVPRRLERDNTNLRIIHGGARGADALAARWAEGHGHSVKAYHADWAKHGTSAGPLRNAKMLELDRPDLVVAFPGGKGTADMVIVVAAPAFPSSSSTRRRHRHERSAAPARQRRCTRRRRVGPTREALRRSNRLRARERSPSRKRPHASSSARRRTHEA